jgi:hypothetical protein
MQDSARDELNRVPRKAPEKDALGLRLPRHLRPIFHAGARLEAMFDRVERMVRRTLASKDMWLLRDSPHELREELDAVLAKRRKHLPYVGCPVCEKFARPIECYCRATGWLTLDDYLRVMREHPESASLFDSEDMAWMIPLTAQARAVLERRRLARLGKAGDSTFHNGKFK